MYCMCMHMYNTSSHFSTSLRTSTFSDRCTLHGSHSMRCHVASPQEQIGSNVHTHACACRCHFLYDMVHMCMYIRMRTDTTLPHISALRFARPHFPIGARCTGVTACIAMLPRLKNKLHTHACACRCLFLYTCTLNFAIIAMS